MRLRSKFEGANECTTWFLLSPYTQYIYSQQKNEQNTNQPKESTSNC